MIQRTSGGMGSALGGGAADQVLGAGSAAQLSKFTVYGILGFFVLSFVLYALYQFDAGELDNAIRAGSSLPAVNTNPLSSDSAGIVQPVEEMAPTTEPVQPGSDLVPVAPKSEADSNNSN